jgi:hypothetical protein
MVDFLWYIVIGVPVLGFMIWRIVDDAAKVPSRQVASGTEPLDPTYEAEIAAASAAGGGWRVLGWLLSIAGAVALIISLFLDTSLPTYSSGFLGGPSEVVNLDLLFRKGVAIACSLTAIGVGLLCLAAGAIIRAIHTRAV